jgi:hypothetical protein
VNARRRQALINAAIAGGITMLLGVALVSVLSGEEPEVVTSPSPSPSPSTVCVPTWEPVQSPDPEDGGSLLLGVSVVSADEAWAVGGAGDPIAPTSTLTTRWNGFGWVVVPSPNAGSVANRFDAVDALSPDAAWAVGRSSDGSGDVPTAAQWDGAAWGLLPLPADLTEGALTGVAALATDDVWAVGYVGDPAEELERAIALRWDGVGWVSAPVKPAIGGGHSALVAIAGTAADDLWAVGYQRQRPVILHYDGRAWARSTTEVRGVLAGVTGVLPDDAWAVGDSIQHWDGSAWAELGTVRQEGDLKGVAAVGPQDVWAVGTRVAVEEGILKPLVQRWDGDRWTLVDGRAPGSITLTAVSAVPDGTVMAVGYQDVRGARSSFVLQARMCPVG